MLSLRYKKRESTITSRISTSELKEEELITSLCLKYEAIFYLKCEKLNFTNELKHAIEYFKTDLVKVLEISTFTNMKLNRRSIKC